MGTKTKENSRIKESKIEGEKKVPRPEEEGKENPSAIAGISGKKLAKTKKEK